MENYFEGTISRLSSYYGVITFDEERQNGEESYTVKRSVPFFSNDLSQYSIGNTVSFSLPQISTSDESNTLLVRGQAVQFATNVQVTNDDTEEVIDKPLDFYQLLNSKLIPSPNLTNISSALDFLKRYNLRYSTFNEILVLSNLIDNQVNFEKVVIDVLFHPSLDEENRKNLLESLIPQAINMFDYVKEHNYDYTGCGGDAIYEITYSKKKVRINLGDNTNWYLYMLKDIADKYPNDDTAETSTWTELQEIREKFGIFFRKDSNARETLIRMLDSNQELECNEGIEQLSKIEEFQKLKSLFLDILNLFN